MLLLMNAPVQDSARAREARTIAEVKTTTVQTNTMKALLRRNSSYPS
jgi:hypothetical protein